jgi:hypothetical protein
LWIILIIVLPLIGGIAWLVAGRPNTRRANTWRIGGGFPEHERPAGRRRVVAPDDDPEFLAQMRKVDEEHEEALRRWEQNLKAREAELRDKDATPPREPGDPGPAPQDPRA